VFCKEQVVQLHREDENIRQAGAELVVVGNGAPHFIKGFREETSYEGKLFTDPSLESYKLAGLKRGFFRVINPVALVYAVRGYARGARQTRMKGDAHQLGGVLIIDVESRILFQHTENIAGDLVDKVKLLAALA
jgi:hypothetical protein